MIGKVAGEVDSGGLAKIFFSHCVKLVNLHTVTLYMALIVLTMFIKCKIRLKLKLNEIKIASLYILLLLVPWHGMFAITRNAFKSVIPKSFQAPFSDIYPTVTKKTLFRGNTSPIVV
jgi:hypothetical protein